MAGFWHPPKNRENVAGFGQILPKSGRVRACFRGVPGAAKTGLGGCQESLLAYDDGRRVLRRLLVLATLPAACPPPPVRCCKSCNIDVASISIGEMLINIRMCRFRSPPYDDRHRLSYQTTREGTPARAPPDIRPFKDHGHSVAILRIAGTLSSDRVLLPCGKYANTFKQEHKTVQGPPLPRMRGRHSGAACC